MIGVIDLERRKDLAAQLARGGLDAVEVFGAESPVEGFLRAHGAGHDPIVLLPSGGDPAAVAPLVRALERGLADAAVLTPARPGLGGLVAGGVLRALSGIDLRRLPSGPIAVTADAALRVSVEAFTAGPGFGLEFLLALHERGLRVIELPSGVGARPHGVRASLRLGAKAWLAQRRGVLGFEGPADLPASGVPSVTQAPSADATDATDQRAPRPLPLVSDSEREAS